MSEWNGYKPFGNGEEVAKDFLQALHTFIDDREAGVST